jgi:hypothetical protein
MKAWMLCENNSCAICYQRITFSQIQTDYGLLKKRNLTVVEVIIKVFLEHQEVEKDYCLSLYLLGRVVRIA